MVGEFIDKVSAAANKAVGTIKEEIGKATGNEKLEAEGDTQQIKGTGYDVKGNVKGALGDKFSFYRGRLKAVPVLRGLVWE